jgi:hypothetical protein
VNIRESTFEAPKVFCIASGPKRSLKYLTSLALGIPNVSCQWVVDCVLQVYVIVHSVFKLYRLIYNGLTLEFHNKGQYIDHRLYALPNGYSIEMKSYLSAIFRFKVFQSKSFFIIGDAKFRKDWSKTLKAYVFSLYYYQTPRGDCHLQKLHICRGEAVVSTKAPTKNNALSDSVDFILDQRGKKWATFEPNSKSLFITTEWIIQSLVNQRLLDPLSNPSYHLQ